MNLDSVSKLFQALNRDKPVGTSVNILIDVGSGKLPVKIPVQNILIEDGVVLIKGEVPNIDVLNKTVVAEVKQSLDIVPDLISKTVGGIIPPTNPQDYSTLETLNDT